MSSQIEGSGASQPSRRDFVRGAAVAGAAAAVAASMPMFVHAAENNTLKIGLVGCGGRGSGAAINALKADSNIKLVALGDMFKDKLDALVSRAGALVELLQPECDRRHLPRLPHRRRAGHRRQHRHRHGGD